MAVTIGLDLVEVAEVRRAIDEHGRSYLERIYTEAELRDSGGRPRLLAARFAAKEAVAKALGSEGELGWHAVAVAVDRRGRPSLVISGRALELADRRGVQAWSLDLTADRTRAVALVLAFWRHGRDERDSHP